MKVGEYMSLTPKQEKFCQCIVSGMSAKDSYITAYDTTGNEKTVYSEATKLLAREDVSKRLEELRKPLENHARTQALTEYEKLKALAWERIEACKASEDDTAVARYMDILNKMLGNYVNINRNIDDTASSLDTLDTETLKALAEAK